jgi:hypothetical protein
MRWFAKSDRTVLSRQLSPEQQSKPTWFFRLAAGICLLYVAYRYLGWCTDLPPAGTAVLWIGVVAVLMSLDLRGPLKTTSLILVFALAFLENKSIQKDHRGAEIQGKELLALAQGTFNSMRQMLEKQDEIKDKDEQILEAQKRNDPALVARLEAEKRDLQRQQLIAVSGELVKEMRYVSEDWATKDQYFRQFYNGQGAFDSLVPKEKREPLEAQYFQSIARLNLSYTQQNMDLFASANDAREKLLLLVPSQDNKTGDAVYAKVLAAQHIDWTEMQTASRYLQNLRNAAVKSLQPT